jgi:hypothetical protein
VLPAGHLKEALGIRTVTYKSAATPLAITDTRLA